jgi:hypothetical protein
VASDRPVPGDRQRGQGEEPQRVLGVPVGLFGPHGRQGPEPQRVLGIPVDLFGPAPRGRAGLIALAHPIRTCRQWVRRRLKSHD